MTTTSIDAGMVKEIFLAGAANLEAKKEWINDLNVFPVPDGDTGTNMTLTIMSASKEVSNIETPDMESLAKAISSGSFKRCKRQFRSYPFPVIKRFYQGNKGI